MPKLRDRGAIQFIVLLILLGGIITAVYLVTSGPLKIFPKAAYYTPSISGPINPQTSLSLTSSKGMYAPNQTFEVKVLARSDIESANLFSAKLSFPVNLLQVESIATDGSFMSKWVEQIYDNNTGEISLVGGVPNPGYQTSLTQPAGTMTIVTFRAKNDIGRAQINFKDDSQIFSNATNANILEVKNNLALTIDQRICAQVITSARNSATGECREFPTPCDVLEGWIEVLSCTSVYTYPTPSTYSTPVYAYPTPYVTPSYGSPTYGTPVYNTPTYSTPTTAQASTGDGNNDGNVNLIDLSIILSDFNKTGNSRRGIDMNGDGKINTFDFGLMRNLLIQGGVIRG